MSNQVPLIGEINIGGTYPGGDQAKGDFAETRDVLPVLIDAPFRIFIAIAELLSNLIDVVTAHKYHGHHTLFRERIPRTVDSFSRYVTHNRYITQRTNIGGNQEVVPNEWLPFTESTGAFVTHGMPLAIGNIQPGTYQPGA